MYYRIRIKQNIQLVFLKVFTGCGERFLSKPCLKSRAKEAKL